MRKLLLCIAFLSTTAFATVDEQKEQKIGELSEKRERLLEVINDPEFQRLFKEVEKDMQELMWIIRENQIRRECFEQYYGEKNEK
jgi:hypothetical protein